MYTLHYSPGSCALIVQREGINAFGTP